jgi:hypothetical protein
MTMTKDEAIHPTKQSLSCRTTPPARAEFCGGDTFKPSPHELKLAFVPFQMLQTSSCIGLFRLPARAQADNRASSPNHSPTRTSAETVPRQCLVIPVDRRSCRRRLFEIGSPSKILGRLRSIGFLYELHKINLSDNSNSGNTLLAVSWLRSVWNRVCIWWHKVRMRQRRERLFVS